MDLKNQWLRKWDDAFKNVTCQCKSAEEFVKCISPTNTVFDGWRQIIYRGQSNAYWELLPSIARNGWLEQEADTYMAQLEHDLVSETHSAQLNMFRGGNEMVGMELYEAIRALVLYLIEYNGVCEFIKIASRSLQLEYRNDYNYQPNQPLFQSTCDRYLYEDLIRMSDGALGKLFSVFNRDSSIKFEPDDRDSIRSEGVELMRNFKYVNYAPYHPWSQCWEGCSIQGNIEKAFHNYFNLISSILNKHSFSGSTIRINHPPIVRDYDEWQLAQYSGVPTILLDWTRSHEISAYFAAHCDKESKYSNDMVVWAVNEDTTKQSFAYPAQNPTTLIPIQQTQEGVLLYWKNLSYGDSSKPYRPFETWLSKYVENGNVRRFILPGSERGNLISWLDRRGFYKWYVEPTRENISHTVKEKMGVRVESPKRAQRS